MFELGTAVVTGAAQGIGAAIAAALHAKGYHVVLVDIDATQVQLQADALGENASACSLDVASPESWTALQQNLVSGNHSLSLLVNNAGIGRSVDIESTDFEAWRSVMAVNADGVFLGTRFALDMMRQGRGSIINIASALGKKPMASTCAYSASKAAVLSLTESTALHCAEQGYAIRCNAVLPGFVDTPMLQASLAASPDSDALLAGFKALHPVGRIGSVDDIARAVLFLADEENNFVTGASLSVDGGMAI
jgi:3alpha(or 20beta)-hydroxysteroid dehydrogenase